jgi:hypothetical protein
MKKALYPIVMTAVSMAAATPGLAADDFRDTGNFERRGGAFAGANLRMPLGTKAATPTARLQLMMTHSFENRQSASPSRTLKAAGFELGISGTKAPALFLNGQNIAQAKRKLGINGSRNTLLIIGGVVLAGAAAYLLFLDDGSDARPANQAK